MSLDKSVIETFEEMSNKDVKKYINSNFRTSYEEWTEIDEKRFLDETRDAVEYNDSSISHRIVNAMYLTEYKCIKEEGKKARYFKRTGHDVSYISIDPSVVHYLHDRGVKF